MDTSGMSQTEVELAGIEIVKGFYRPYLATGADFIDTSKMRQPEKRQRTLGDFLFPSRLGDTRAFEVKTERQWTGNIFIEVWSNLTKENQWRRDGWIYTLSCDVIAFVFLDDEVFYAADFPALQDWCWREQGGMYEHKQKDCGAWKSGKQKNRTVGHCVPIRELIRWVEMKTYRPDPFGAWALVENEPQAMVNGKA